MFNYIQEENMFRTGYHYGTKGRGADESWNEYKAILEEVKKNAFHHPFTEEEYIIKRSKPGIEHEVENHLATFDEREQPTPEEVEIMRLQEMEKI